MWDSHETHHLRIQQNSDKMYLYAMCEKLENFRLKFQLLQKLWELRKWPSLTCFHEIAAIMDFQRQRNWIYLLIKLSNQSETLNLWSAESIS